MSASGVNSLEAERTAIEQRQHFERWLRSNRSMATKMPMRVLLSQYGLQMSKSSAYRIAVRTGLRGRRHNSSRYDDFWALINWALPDNTLEQIWGVSRQNVRHRRVRIGAGEPEFTAHGQTWPDDFISAFNREIEKEQKYHGPRPR